LRSIERPVNGDFVNNTFDSVGAALNDPEYLDALDSIDSSAEQHRAVMLRVFKSAGLDDELALALYDLDFDPVCHPLYPDVPSVLTAIRERGVKIALVSNIHFDLRGELDAQGVGHLIDEYVLSFEQGFQKPDPRMFEFAMEAVSVDPKEALMVGDSPSHDGAAVGAGITTLLLPPPPTVLGPRGLDVLLHLLD
jgi:HAD superfamily hydrolase (TIGR01509 family)